MREASRVLLEGRTGRLGRKEVGRHEGEERREADERRRRREPPASRPAAGERHHDHERQADEQELCAEHEPVLEQRLEVAGVRLVVAAVPPRLDEPEGNLREPDEREADHPEEHPRPDPPGRRLAGERRSAPGVEREHDEQDELRGDEVGAQEALVRLGPFEQRGVEQGAGREVGTREAVRDAGLPERRSGESPRRCEREQAERASEARASGQAAASPACSEPACTEPGSSATGSCSPPGAATAGLAWG